MSLRTAVVVLCVTFGLNVALFAFWVFPRISGATAANCLRIHRLTGTLDQILINGRVSATRYERDGTITRAQLRLALRDNDVARSKLYRADCPPGSAPPLK
jgi:hypothetical protein